MDKDSIVLKVDTADIMKDLKSLCEKLEEVNLILEKVTSSMSKLKLEIKI